MIVPGRFLLKSSLVLRASLLSNRFLATMTDNEYHLISDKTLNTVFDYVDNEYIESILSQGVLKFEIDSKFWVLNKQTPNKQIWWSSPISGPLRFEYDNNENKSNTNTNHPKLLLTSWKCTKDGSNMYDRLQREILEATKIDISK